MDYLRKEVEAHLRNYDEHNINDFIDAYLKEMKTGVNPELYSVDKLVNILSDLTAAGVETTTTTIKWAVLYLIRQPDIQDRMKTELDDVIGASRFPRLSDRPNLPYCNAVINESIRLANTTPLGIPRLVPEDFICNGFKIPKDGVVFPCLDSVVYDETLFPNSQQFNPERFLDENGKLCNQEKLMNFSVGRRICPGESFARKRLFLYFTTLIQMFEFHPVKEEGLPSTESVFGMTNSPYPYKFRAILRH